MPGTIESESNALVDELIAASREIGGDPRLVLQGGGNTSVKVGWRDVTGKSIPALLIKGSGHDLGTIDRAGFAALRLHRLRELLPPTRIDSADLDNELRCALLEQQSPDPSLETLVHAALPHAAVLHSHADSLLAITNTPRGAERVREIWGDRILVVEYAMPGPELAAACHAAWIGAESRHDVLEGIVVLHHGLFTFADTPAGALALHRQIIDSADQYLERDTATEPVEPQPAKADPLAIARLRREISEAIGTSIILRCATSERITDFVSDPVMLAAAGRGPLTPDHVIWTGHSPMVGRDLDAYRDAYDQYFTEHCTSVPEGVATPLRLPAAPRVILDPTLGLATVGRNGAEAKAVQRIYLHTMDAIAASESLGGYTPADPQHVFDLEHWPAQREKLVRKDAQLSLGGHIALVTGAASGIGRACAEVLLAAGACVIGWDISPEVSSTFDSENWHGVGVDVTDATAVRHALAEGVAIFGGLDIVVVAAGVFPQAQHLAVLDPGEWRRTMTINVDSVAALYSEVHPLLKESPAGGRVIVIASKNVAAPGPGAAAYSASKAALVQLSRVAALEWAADGIRVNQVHPDAVFDTALWTPELLNKRAEHYGMTVDQYKRRNLLGAEVTSKVVAQAVRALADDTFSCTTGAQLPVDGGNDRVI
jgi:rhamnose utilization protein RhaD (predicted bifunctional aldolase and dehydrogenase)/NAD(P)-dependent dehydrogenase (short-subunit alcohol dehydrogenase family)